jgi:hypothetical protein
MTRRCDGFSRGKEERGLLLLREAGLFQESGRFFEKKLRKKLLIPAAAQKGNQKFFGYFFSKK